ncbi:hypothetical protein IMZ48_19890 [Candidatus Bathyarchaeota archaeon]|nr:hypothetical protein [Candidatus Bathyarchaeota archaeon]
MGQFRAGLPATHRVVTTPPDRTRHQYLIPRELDGASRVTSHYHDPWNLKPSSMTAEDEVSRPLPGQ